VTQLVAAIRLVPAACEIQLSAHDHDRPGKPACAWDDAEATQALVSGLVGDALAVLAAVADVELGVEQAEAVALLALVAGQDVEPGERPGAWRIARKVAKDRVVSTVDAQARHARKTSAQRRDGYKGHVAAEPETGLVTECALTAATAPDGPIGGSGCWPARRPAWRCWATPPTAVGRPARPGAPPATSRRSSRCRWPVRSRAGSPSTTSRSIPRPARSAARPAPRPASPHRARPASPAAVSAAAHCVSAARPPPAGARSASTPPRRAAHRPPPCHHPRLPAQLPALAADGGTLAGLAGRRRLPAGALPRDRAQRGVVVAAGRRGQPAPPAGAWPCPPGWRLGAGLRPDVLALSLRLTRRPPATEHPPDRPDAERPQNYRPDRTGRLQQAPSHGFFKGDQRSKINEGSLIC
jgi:hypothetical protein